MGMHKLICGGTVFSWDYARRLADNADYLLPDCNPITAKAYVREFRNNPVLFDEVLEHLGPDWDKVLAWFTRVDRDLVPIIEDLMRGLKNGKALLDD